MALDELLSRGIVEAASLRRSGRGDTSTSEGKYNVFWGILSIALCAMSAQAGLAGTEQPQAVGPAVAVVPQRIGHLQADGTVSEWFEHGQRQGCVVEIVWDAFDPVDPTDDGDTDQADLGILLAHWGEGCG